VRRGASWTAAYHLQLTVAAEARPVRSSVVPSSYVLLSGQALSPWSTLPGRRRGVGHRCPAGGVHSAGSSSGIRLSSRLVSGPPGVRSPRVVVRGPAICPAAVLTRPALWRPPVRCPPVHPSGVQPSAVHPLCPVASVSSHLRRWRWGPGPGAGNRHHSNRSRSPVAAAPSGGWVDGRAALRAGDAAWGRGLVSRGSVADPGRGGGRGRRPRVPAARPGRPAGVRSARGWRRRWGRASRLRRELAAPAGWLPSRAGWATTVGGGRGGGPSGWPPARMPAGDGGAAPARPRLAAGAPGRLSAAL
jgi:hypothetical protein